MPKQTETAKAIANSPHSDPLLDFVLDIQSLKDQVFPSWLQYCTNLLFTFLV